MIDTFTFVGGIIVFFWLGFFLAAALGASKEDKQ